MAKRETYWTPKRLIELRVKARSMTADELISHFNRSWDDIQQAQLFEANLRRLKREPRVEIIGNRRVTITCYAAEYAEGARIPLAYTHL